MIIDEIVRAHNGLTKQGPIIRTGEEVKNQEIRNQGEQF